MERIIFTHTTTIGLRKYPVERTVLDRRQETVDTAFGPAKVKICRYENQTFFYPEYESVREICRARDLPFGDVCREITEAAVRGVCGGAGMMRKLEAYMEQLAKQDLCVAFSRGVDAPALETRLQPGREDRPPGVRGHI